MTKAAEKRKMKARELALDLINNSNRSEEKHLQALIAPIDPALTVHIFNTSNPFEWEVAVGYNGENVYQPGERFKFGINSHTLLPFITENKYPTIFGFDTSPDEALEWLRQAVARRVWNYFKDRPDRVLRAVDPIKWWKQYGA